MKWLSRCAIILFLSLLTGCAGVSQFIASHADDGQSLDDPQNTILLIYNHGSRPEFNFDQCHPNEWTSPPVVKRLNGRRIQGRTVRVYGLCSNGFLGNYNHRARQGEAKVVKRSRMIAAEVQRFQALGVPAKQIFLVGHSAGAWASLLVMADAQVAPNAMIGFAPAFAGLSQGRAKGWQQLRDQHINAIQAADSIPALIYVAEEDPYEPASELAFLQTINGVELKRMSAVAECTSTDVHRLAFQDCFADSEAAMIEAFVAQRLKPAESH